MQAEAWSGQGGGDSGHDAADAGETTESATVTEIPPGWATVSQAAEQLDISVETIRRRYRDRNAKTHLPFHRLPDGRVIVNVAAYPKDLLERAYRLRRMVNDVTHEAEGRTAIPEIRRHLRWLEERMERMEDEHTAERRRLLDIIDRLTGKRGD
jgi:hypothetical protein